MNAKRLTVCALETLGYFLMLSPMWVVLLIMYWARGIRGVLLTLGFFGMLAVITGCVVVGSTLVDCVKHRTSQRNTKHDLKETLQARR